MAIHSTFGLCLPRGVVDLQIPYMGFVDVVVNVARMILLLNPCWYR